MLPLDHIPFQGPDLPALARAFAGLGFAIAPRACYTSPDEPDARWDNHCVFMDRGWFDLLQAPGAPATVVPGAALFRATNLEAAAAQLKGMRLLPPYRLLRQREGGHAHEPFRLISIRERITPLGLAVIEHAYPCADAMPAWFAHPNTAIEVVGLAFAGAQPGPFAQAAGEVLDLTGFEYWTSDQFRDVFGLHVDYAVRVRVASLATARAALAGDLVVQESKGRLHVAPPSPLNCGFQFFEA